MIAVRKNVIGVSISTSSVKIAYTTKNAKGYTIRKLAEEKIPVSALVAGVIRQSDNVIAALQKCIQTTQIDNWKKIYAICTIPDDRIYMQEASFPDLPADKLKEAIEFKVQSFIPLPLSSVYWDYNVVKKNSDQTISVLVSAAAKETVDSFHDVLKQAGIRAISFEGSANAALRLIPVEEKPCILVDIGTTQSTVSLAQQGFIKFSSTVHLGTNQIIKTYDEFFNTDDDKSLQLLNKSGLDTTNPELKDKLLHDLGPIREEISKTVHYQTQSIGHIYLFGEGAGFKDIEKLFIADPSLPVTYISFPIKASDAYEIPKYASLIGASIKPFAKTPMTSYLPELAKKDINHAIITDKIFFFLQILSINFLAVSTVLGAFLLYISIDQTYLNQKLQDTKNTSTPASTNALAQTIQTDNANLLKIQIAENAQVDWTGFLTEQAKLVPSGISLTSYDAIVQLDHSWNVSISGIASTRDILLSYLQTLESSSKYLSQVSLPISYIQSDKSITFTIQAKLASLSIKP